MRSGDLPLDEVREVARGRYFFADFFFAAGFFALDFAAGFFFAAVFFAAGMTRPPWLTALTNSDRQSN